jgi:hypothetical protein
MGNTYTGINAGGIDNYTKLMVHADATFADSAISPHAETVTNAVISSTQSKFGGNSGYFDGSGDWVSYAYASDFHFAGNDFTIDFWVYMDEADGTAQRRMIGFGSTVVDVTAWNLTQAYEWLICTFGPGANQGKLYAVFNDNAGGASRYILTSPIDIHQSWHHIAVVKYGNILTAYLDGISIGSYNPGGAWVVGTVTDTCELVIGNNNNPALTTTEGWKGYIDEVRVSNGIARWTSNFNVTPGLPTQAYAVYVPISYFNIDTHAHESELVMLKGSALDNDQIYITNNATVELDADSDLTVNLFYPGDNYLGDAAAGDKVGHYIVNKPGRTLTVKDTATNGGLSGEGANSTATIKGSPTAPITVKAFTPTVLSDANLSGSKTVYENVVFEDFNHIKCNNTTKEYDNVTIKGATGATAWMLDAMPAVWKNGCGVNGIPDATNILRINFDATHAQMNKLLDNLKVVSAAAGKLRPLLLAFPSGTSYLRGKIGATQNIDKSRHQRRA